MYFGYIDAVVVMAMVAFWLSKVRHERKLTREARRRLVFIKWVCACENLLIWRIQNRPYEKARVDEIWMELMREQNKLAVEFTKLGGSPHDVDFWKVYGTEWSGFIPSQFEDVQTASKSFAQFTA